MKKITFIILHYQNMEDTMGCVKSIRECIEYDEKAIVIVDNASSNGSGERLENLYKKTENIYVLKNKQNEGYAKGNNLGYQFAKRELKSDFIIILNNDTEIRQSRFCNLLIEKYNDTGYHVLGPDIVDLNGNHQNPHRMELVGEQKLKKVIRNRTLIICFMKVLRFLHLTNGVKLLEILEQSGGNKEQKNELYKTEHRNIVLQGSCIVFSPAYVKENEEAFYPKTFLYFEEDILAHKCQKKGYETLYTPSVSILHKCEASTKYNKSAFQKVLFVTEKRLESAKVFLDYIREND